MTGHPIGTKYKTRGKCPRECIVIDIIKSYNVAGVLVHTRYVAAHEFGGRTIIARDVRKTTISMGLVPTQSDVTRLTNHSAACERAGYTIAAGKTP